jgi:NADH-quinone oxidoreductase subunit N
MACLGFVPLIAQMVQGERRGKLPVAAWLSALGCAVVVYLCATSNRWGSLWNGMFVWDAYSAFFCALFALVALLVCLAAADDKYGGEFFALTLLSSVGMMFMVTSGNLLMLYLSLELSTIPLFVLAGYDKSRRRSGEASFKFLAAAGTASAVLLFGASWVYGAVGTTSYDALHRMLATSVPAYAWAGVVLVIGAFGFKIAAAPFHLWAPDVYEGAPSPVTAFLSTASKAAGFVALMRWLIMGAGLASSSWVNLIVALAAITLILGNLVALVQTNVKRLLAYSGIAHAGFILIAVAAGTQLGTTAVAIYLLLYAFANVGAFLCVYSVSERNEDHSLASYDGLSRRAPKLAFAFLIFLLSLAGIPPLAGFVGKWYLFMAGMESGLWGLVLLGAIASTVSLYYYLVVAKRMYIHAPPEGAQEITVSRPLSLSIGICVLMTAVIGLYPLPWIELARQVGAALH